VRLAGDVAVITGAGQGIGRAYGLRFAREGARVVLADVQRDKVHDVAREVQDTGGEALAVISSTIEQKPFEDITLDEWNRIIAVNLTGAFLCCQAVAPSMRARRGGRIINIASAVARRAGPWRYAHYVASKAGIMGLTRALATELGADGITVNAISPGPVETEMAGDAPVPEQIKTLIAAQVIHRREVPEDLVGVAVFLASEDGRFITGQVINVDGGLNFN
jgi:3-oxoacyl-[acyl-carrier protein] reductase